MDAESKVDALLWLDGNSNVKHQVKVSNNSFVINSEADNRFSCHICKKIFSARSELTAHWTTHKEYSESSGWLPDNVSSPECRTAAAKRKKCFVPCSCCGINLKLKCENDTHPVLCTSCKTLNVESDAQRRSVVESVSSLSDEVLPLQNGQIVNSMPETIHLKPKELNPFSKVFPYNRRVYNCQVCHRKFNNRKGIANHRRSHSMSNTKPKCFNDITGKYRCSVCGEVLPSKSALFVHLKSHKQMKKYGENSVEGKTDLDTSFETGVQEANSDATLNGSDPERSVRVEISSAEKDSPDQEQITTLRVDFGGDISRMQGFGVIGRGETDALGTYECKICRNISRNAMAYARHVKWHNAQDRQFKCRYCKKKFGNEDALRSHITNDMCAVKDGKNWPKLKWVMCELCDRRFLSRRKLFTHKTEVHNLASSDTTEVGDNSGQKSGQQDLTATKSKVHGSDSEPRKNASSKKIFCCNICKKKFSKLDRLIIHKAKKHDVKKKSYLSVKNRCHVCSLCNVNFHSRKAFYAHNAKVHIKDATTTEACTKTHVCSVCQKKFSTVKGMLIHKYHAHKQTSYSCQYCDKCFSARNYLKLHMRCHSDKIEKDLNGQDRVSCASCNETFPLLGLLADHLVLCQTKTLFPNVSHVEPASVHVSESQLSEGSAHDEESAKGTESVCNLCNRSFKSLNKHVGHMHKQKKSVVTKETRSRDLVTDKETKDRDRAAENDAVSCKRCRTTFSTVALLPQHECREHKASEYDRTDGVTEPVNNSIPKEMKPKNVTREKDVEIPNEQRDFTCPICGKEFRTYKNLNLHAIYSHLSKEENFMCNFCSKGFSTLRCLRIHRTRIHASGSLTKERRAISVVPVPAKGRMMPAAPSSINGKVAGNVKNEDCYECPYCDKSTPSRKGLVIHQARIHGIRGVQKAGRGSVVQKIKSSTENGEDEKPSEDASVGNVTQDFLIESEFSDHCLNSMAAPKQGTDNGEYGINAAVSEKEKSRVSSNAFKSPATDVSEPVSVRKDNVEPKNSISEETVTNRNMTMETFLSAIGLSFLSTKEATGIDNRTPNFDVLKPDGVQSSSAPRDDRARENEFSDRGTDVQSAATTVNEISEPVASDDVSNGV